MAGQIRRRLPGWLLQLCGVIFLVQVGIGFLGLPGVLTRWLVGGVPQPIEDPRYVVVLGGGGIPSGSGLIRTYCAADYGVGLTGVTFIVALPADGDPATNSVGRMRDELVLRGIPREQVLLESKGRNTHEQAMNIRRMLDSDRGACVVLVSSPFHIRRSLLCFRQQGFERVVGLPAFGTGAEADLGGNTALRYDFWSNLTAGVEALRELCALAQYGLCGWL